MKHLYTFEEYQEDLNKIEDIIYEYLDTHDNVVLCSLYRGSLGLGVYMSNRFNLPLNILKYQTYSGTDDEVQPLYEVPVNKDTNILLLDDIADSYKSLKKVKEYYTSVKSMNSITIFGNKKKNETHTYNTYLRENNNKWIVFLPNGESIDD